jgi:hypothetical protein
MKHATTILVLLCVAGLAACKEDGNEYQVDGYSALEHHVLNNRVGSGVDSWIEIRNALGEWEKTGLIFGYFGDHEECEKAINGLKVENYAREYRCTPAN